MGENGRIVWGVDNNATEKKMEENTSNEAELNKAFHWANEVAANDSLADAYLGICYAIGSGSPEAVTDCKGVEDPKEFEEISGPDEYYFERNKNEDTVLCAADYEATLWQMMETRDNMAKYICLYIYNK